MKTVGPIKLELPSEVCDYCSTRPPAPWKPTPEAETTVISTSISVSYRWKLTPAKQRSTRYSHFDIVPNACEVIIIGTSLWFISSLIPGDDCKFELRAFFSTPTPFSEAVANGWQRLEVRGIIYRLLKIADKCTKYMLRPPIKSSRRSNSKVGWKISNYKA